MHTSPRFWEEALHKEIYPIGEHVAGTEESEEQIGLLGYVQTK